MKKISLILIVISIMLTFCGCIKPTQLNQRSLIQGVAIDYEDNKIVLTFEIFSPSSISKSGVEANSENTTICTSSGCTVSEAIYNANILQGKKIFLGQNRVVIISKKVSEKENISTVLSNFLASYSSNQNAYIVMCEEKAKDILFNEKDKKIVSAQKIEKVIKNSSDSGYSKAVKIFEYFISEKNVQGASMIPKISTIDNTNTDDYVKIQGNYIFSNGKNTSFISENQIKSYLIFTNKINKAFYSITTAKKVKSTVEIYNCKSKFNAVYKDNIPVFNLEVKAKVRLIEYIYNSDYYNLKEIIPDLENSLKAEITVSCNNLFNNQIASLDADILNLNNTFLNADLKKYNSLKENKAEFFKSAKLNIKIDLDFDRTDYQFN